MLTQVNIRVEVVASLDGCIVISTENGVSDASVIKKIGSAAFQKKNPDKRNTLADT